MAKQPTPPNCLVQKFKGYSELNEADTRLLDELHVDEKPADRGDIVHQDESPSTHLYVVKTGWFACVKELCDGGRAITELALPGDVIGLRDVTYSHRLSALHCLSNNAVICPFTKERLHRLFARSVKLTEIFFAVMSREHAQLVQRLVTVSRREGIQRIAHLILETAIRLEGISVDVRRDFDFPVDQRELADLTGMSAVHASRCMTDLRARELIAYSKGRMHILDRQALHDLAEFDSAFLAPDLGWLRSIELPED